MTSKRLPLIALMMLPAALQAQYLRDGYIDWGVRNTAFPEAVQSWSKGQAWSSDDNFFISRVKPKARFRNQATQINPLLTEENDKKLINWLPINREAFNALPDGRYDSEVFPMWQYVTHWGNWTAQLIRMPGNFADVAHRNGVPVSVLASIPYGNITDSWQKALSKLSKTDPALIADYLDYYGVDGIGYNSEFNGSAETVTDLSNLHSSVRRILHDSGKNPFVEFIWYDGTNERGKINFDRGLGSHNDDIWGYGENIRTALFFNYNWNNENLLSISSQNAELLGRSPLDLYCGINMQGREPNNSNPERWPLLTKYNLSIGLWGAHSENMFFEGRGARGTVADNRIRSYLLRTEKWYTGGTRNPLTSPEINNDIIHGDDADSFFGMSRFMSARSSLKWDLSEEPFISYFNLGNGKFFNWKGERCHNSEWYNIGIQDYLPTWKWWFTTKFLGRDAADVPASGLDAEFVWDDAWMWGSTVRIFGSHADEYLHLFKTEYLLQDGDEITFRYKVVGGKADLALALSAKGAEETVIDESRLKVLSAADETGSWRECSFRVGSDLAWPGGELAMVALHFTNAENLDLRLGEFSIIRPGATAVVPQSPVIEKAEILSSRHSGADAKIIFNMPNDKAPEVCYNIDVNTSLFKLYAWQENHEPVLMGMTTSWAGLMFSIPVDMRSGGDLRLGVSAMSLDMKSESEIAWSELLSVADSYEVDDEIALSNPVINPGQGFSISYIDPRHELADWTLTDGEGNVVASAEGVRSIEIPAGLPAAGSYDLTVDGVFHSGIESIDEQRVFKAFVQVTPDGTGHSPRILSFLADNEDIEEFHNNEGKQTMRLDYTAVTGDASLSRGVRVGDSGIGFKCADAGIDASRSFTVSFWLKPESFGNDAIHLFNIRDKGDNWPNNQWGWFWHTMNADGTTSEFTLRMNANGNAVYRFDGLKIVPGVWHHFAYSFEINDKGNIMPHFWVDGKKQEITSWSRGDKEMTIKPICIGVPYKWRSGNVAAVGGYLHKRGSVRGNVDDLMVWDHLLSEEEVRMAMGDIRYDMLPEGLLSSFNFENDPEEAGYFKGVGKAEFVVGAHDYLSSDKEGEGAFRWNQPEFCAGSPFSSGSAWKLNSNVEFIAEGASLIESEGNPEKGSALFSIPATGYGNVGVRISNELGSDTRSVRILGADVSSVETVQPDEIFSASPSPFDSYIDVTAPESGRYRISLYALDGRRILVNDFNAGDAGETMRIYPQAESGIYMLTLDCGERRYRSLKVVKR